MNEDNQYGSNENKKITEENSEETLISEPGENMLIEFQRDGQSQEDTLSCPFSYSGPMQQITTDSNHPCAKENTIQDSQYISPRKRKMEKCSNENLESDEKLLTQDQSDYEPMQGKFIPYSAFSITIRKSSNTESVCQYPRYTDNRDEDSQYWSEPNRKLIKICNETSKQIGSEDQSDNKFQGATFGLSFSQIETETSNVIGSLGQSDKEFQVTTFGFSFSQTETQTRGTQIVHDNPCGIDRDEDSQGSSEPNRKHKKICHETSEEIGAEDQSDNKFQEAMCGTSEKIGSEDQSDNKFQGATFGLSFSQIETETSKVIGSLDQSDKEVQETKFGFSFSQTEAQTSGTQIVHDNPCGIDRDVNSQSGSEAFKEIDAAIPGPSSESSKKPISQVTTNGHFSSCPSIHFGTVSQDLYTEKSYIIPEHLRHYRNPAKTLSDNDSGESTETDESSVDDNPILTALFTGRSISEILKDPTFHVRTSYAEDLLQSEDADIPLNILLENFVGLIINEREIRDPEFISENATNSNAASSSHSTATSPIRATIAAVTNHLDVSNIGIKHYGLPYTPEGKKSKIELYQLNEKGKDSFNVVRFDYVFEDKNPRPSHMIRTDDSDTISTDSVSSEISLISVSSSYTTAEVSPKYEEDLVLDMRKVWIKRRGSPIEYEPESKKIKFDNRQLHEEETDTSNEGRLDIALKDNVAGPYQNKENDEVCLAQQILKISDSLVVSGEEDLKIEDGVNNDNRENNIDKMEENNPDMNEMNDDEFN